MDKKQLQEEFEKNVKFLQRVVPPDDIYAFAEETYMAALFFLKKWSECEDIKIVAKDDEVAKKYVNNICSFLVCRNKNMDIRINLDLESVEDD